MAIIFVNSGRDSSKVSSYSRKVIKKIMETSGISSIKITSTARTTDEQLTNKQELCMKI